MQISEDIPLMRIVKTQANNVPPLGEKMLVDLVNGLDVAGPLIAAQKQRGFLTFVWESIDGSSNRRSALINERHQEALTVILRWLLELTEKTGLSQRAMTEVAVRLAETRRVLADMADVHCEHRDVLERHEKQIQALSLQVKEHDVRLNALERRLGAREYLDSVLTKWKAGRLFRDYPPMIQAAFALMEIARAEEGMELLATQRQLVADQMGAVLMQTPLRQIDYAPVSCWLQAQDPLDPELQPIAEYLLAEGSFQQKPMRHLLLCSGGTRPAWFSELQRNGHVSGFLNMQDCLMRLIEEVRP